MPFCVKRYYCLTDDQEMVVLGHYATFDEAKDRMVEAVVRLLKKSQILALHIPDTKKGTPR